MLLKHIQVSCNWYLFQISNMDWIILVSSRERENSLETAVNNWTKPFIKNVVQTFNNSMAGPQRFHNQTLVEGPLQYTEQTLLVLPLLVIICLKHILNKDSANIKNIILLTWPQFISPNITFHLASYLVFAIILPISIVMVVCSFIYRKIAKVILQLKYKEKFIKLLDGTDAIWALEEDKAKSIINVVATVEVDQIKCKNPHGDILEKLQYTVERNFLTKRTSYPKMFFKRSCKLGYFYWEANDKINIEDFIRPMGEKNCELSREDLYRLVSELSNSDMPHNNSATWEILVGQSPIIEEPESITRNVRRYPLLFRIHHSLGDGVVLVKLLLKTIADEEKSIMKRQLSIVIPIDDFKSSIKQLFCLSNLNKIKAILLKIFKSTVRALNVLMMVPMSLMGQLSRPLDNNVLHGTPLEGKKICVWLKESDVGEGVLKKIKKMKNKIHGSTFSDWFLTALSASYHNYFAENATDGKSSIPNLMTSIVPIRVERSDLNLQKEIKDPTPLKLENRFTVAMLTIPIKVGDKSDSNNVTHLKRLAEVKKHTNELKESADFYINYFIMSLLGHVFPTPLLRPVLKSEHASLVISNLPGPSNVTICGGHRIKEMSFFVPHRGTTGMGVTLLSYNGRVNLGLMVDKAVMNNVKDAENILKGALNELELLDDITSRLT